MTNVTTFFVRVDAYVSACATLGVGAYYLLNTDSVRCYRLDSIAVERTQILGIGRVTVAPPYLVGRKS